MLRFCVRLNLDKSQKDVCVRGCVLASDVPVEFTVSSVPVILYLT